MEESPLTKPMLCNCSLFLYNGKENGHILPREKYTILVPHTVTDEGDTSGYVLPTTLSHTQEVYPGGGSGNETTNYAHVQWAIPFGGLPCYLMH